MFIEINATEIGGLNTSTKINATNTSRCREEGCGPIEKRKRLVGQEKMQRLVERRSEEFYDS